MCSRKKDEEQKRFFWFLSTLLLLTIKDFWVRGRLFTHSSWCWKDFIMISLLCLSCENGVKVLVSYTCPTLSDPMDCSLPGSSAHGILQARILEWVAIPFSKKSSKPRDQTQVSCISGSFFTI